MFKPRLRRRDGRQSAARARGALRAAAMFGFGVSAGGARLPGGAPDHRRRVRRGSRREHAHHRRGSGPGCARRHELGAGGHRCTCGPWWCGWCTGWCTWWLRYSSWCSCSPSGRPRPRLPAEEARRARHPLVLHGAHARLRRHRLARGQAHADFRHSGRGTRSQLFTGDMNFITFRARLAHLAAGVAHGVALHGARGPGVRAGHRRLLMLRGLRALRV